MTRAKVLAAAAGELGVSESPAGSNRVKYNTAYYGRAVSGEAYPWCCVFLWWCFRQAGAASLFYGGGKTASCGALADFARRQGRYVTGGYQPGDLVMFHFGGGAIRHIGIVERAEGDLLTTIEGNTGANNDANGGQVQRRKRRIKDVAGAYRPAYQEDEMTQGEFDAMMNDWLSRRAALEPGDFSRQARDWGEGTGIIQGGGNGSFQYKSFCTREQMLVFLHRMAQSMKKA